MNAEWVGERYAAGMDAVKAIHDHPGDCQYAEADIAGCGLLGAGSLLLLGYVQPEEVLQNPVCLGVVGQEVSRWLAEHDICCHTQ